MELEAFIKRARGPKGYKLAEFIVVNPYPVAEFFNGVVKALRPKSCVILVDDGWPQVRVEAVMDVLNRKNIRAVCYRVKSPKAGGLVHAKLYFFRWKNSTSRKQIRKFYFGSPNASTQGFGVHSEVLAEVAFKYLSSKMKAEADKYFMSLSSGSNETSATVISNDAGTRIWLPEIHISSPNELSFDSWIRSGRLCHRYSPDTAFGKLTVKLRKPLEKTGDEEAFASHGFVKETRREVLQRPYAGTIDTKDENPQWRAKHFTETEYGDWTSNECFVAQQDGQLTSRGRNVVFQSQGANERANIISAIKDGSEDDHNEWIKEFGNALIQVADQMTDQGMNPKNYLQIKAGQVDLQKYKKQWRKKLQSDRARALIPDFFKRMESGFSFPLIPPLGPEYEAFVHSLCATLLRGARLIRRRNALAKIIYDIIDKERISEIEDGEEMYEELLEVWENQEYREQIQQFYFDETSNDDEEWA